MNLYLVHLGYYDDALGGIYENHVNFFIAAESFEEACARAKSRTDVREKRMHVDGMQRIERVDGFEVTLNKVSAELENLIVGERHRQLARS